MIALEPLLGGKRHVIWDWNGTLLADVDAALAALNLLLAEEKRPALTRDQFRQTIRFPIREWYRELGLDVEPAAFQGLCDRFHTHFGRTAATCDLWPDTRRLLANIKAAGRVQSVLSLMEQSLLDGAVKRLGLNAFFDHVWGGLDNLVTSKVERGRELLRAVGIPAAETMMIGDMDHDWEVAQAIGVDVVLVDHGYQHPDRLLLVHDRVVRVLP